MAGANEQRFRDGYAAFQRGDLEALGSEYFTPDIVWHSPGKNRFSGDYSGLEEIFKLFEAWFDETEGNFTVEVHDILANQEHGIALAILHGRRGEKEVDDRYTHVVHFRDEKVFESWIHFDHPDLLDAFWA